MVSIKSLVLSSSSVIGRILLALTYAILYEYIYLNFTFRTFEYMGVEHTPFNTDVYIIYILFAVFPIIWFKGVRTISSCLSIMGYIFMYIPIIESVFATYYLSFTTRIEYAVVLVVCMSLFFYSDQMFLFKKEFSKKSKTVNISIIRYIVITLCLILFITNIGNLRFVNVFTQRELMYDLRSELAENSMFGMGYIIKWLSNAFLPLLLIYYLKKKNWIRYWQIIGFYILVFMLTMQKSTFFLPFLLTSFYWLVEKYPRAISNYLFTIIVISLLSISILLLILSETRPIYFSIAAVLFYRTMCVSGHLFSMYVHFFDSNPHTYYTHIGIIDKITNAYPYDDVLGKVVANGDMNANASFLLTDGIAAAGIGGIICISIVFIVFKGLLNSIQLKYDKNICIVIFLPCMISFLNVSLFTSMITGGALVLYFLFKYVSLPTLKKQQK